MVNENIQKPLRKPQITSFVEHPPVFTLGKSGKMEHLLVDQEQLEKDGFEFFPVNRGGDITYHGPGQIVGYPIIDLDHYFTDIHNTCDTSKKSLFLHSQITALKPVAAMERRVYGWTTTPLHENVRDGCQSIAVDNHARLCLERQRRPQPL